MLTELHVRVLDFAAARQRLRRNEEELVLSTGATAGDAWRLLEELHPEPASLRPVLRLAVNEEFVMAERVLVDGDVIALIPPVAGGASGLYRVSDEALSLDEVVGRSAATSKAGSSRPPAWCAAEPREEDRAAGVRGVSADGGAEAGGNWRLDRRGVAGARVAIVHRVGVLGVGETAVVIAASAPHRAAAFEACRAAIDRLKESVPIGRRKSPSTASSGLASVRSSQFAPW